MRKDNLQIRELNFNRDSYSTQFEKDLQMLTPNLKFIKKYIYYNLLPKVDSLIEDLEKIKLTPNYEEKITFLKPQSVIKIKEMITCVDLFETHNIRNMKTNKIIYGTSQGNVVIFDLETGRNIWDKRISLKGRIESVVTSTIKYYDTYLSRIAISIRGNSQVSIFTYNHSFSKVEAECNINLKESNQNELNLSDQICTIKFSKDAFYLSLVDYAGGVRVYKLPDLSNKGKDSHNLSIQNKVKKESGIQIQMNFQKKANTGENEGQLFNGDSPMLIAHVNYKEVENITIVPLNEEEMSKTKTNPTKESTNKNVKSSNVIHPETKILNNLHSSSNIYKINETVDSEGNDITEMQPLNITHPFIIFIQKEFSHEDKRIGSYTNVILTVGVYIAFSNTNCFKFLNFYSHITESMKVIHKVPNNRPYLSIEESISLSSSIGKKEKEFINFIKIKLENSAQKESDNNILQTPTKNELTFSTTNIISTFAGQKEFSNKLNIISIGMDDGSILIWDPELHLCRKYLKEQNIKIVSLQINEEFLVSGTLDGGDINLQLKYR